MGGLLLFMSFSAAAHDPVFGLGPHTLFKGGTEIHFGTELKHSNENQEVEQEIQLKYGLNADWVIGLELPFGSDARDNQLGDEIHVVTKYRFWRHDRFAVQESAAVAAKAIINNSPQTEVLAPDGNDYLLGISYGYEGRKWYRWASLRKRFNAKSQINTERPDVWLIDIVGGIRFYPAEYFQADWVWMLELNGELIDKQTVKLGDISRKIGGEQWFISPGLMWTYRNFAIKSGIQFLLTDNLESDQVKDDYRAKIELELHL